MRTLGAWVLVMASAALGEEGRVAALEPERPTFEFGVGTRGFLRTYGPSDGTRFLSTFSGASAGVAVDAQWYPGRPATAGVGGNVGLYGEGAFSLGLVATLGTHSFAAAGTTLRGGLVWRVPLGQASLIVTAGLASQAFETGKLSADSAPRPTLPDVGFLGPRVGLGTRVCLLPKTLEAELSAGFTWAFQSGELATVMTSPTSLGVDARLWVAWRALPTVSLKLGGDFSRVFVSTSSHAAADQSLGLSLALAVAL